MSGERLLVFGFGYSARAIAARMRPKLGAVWGTTRDADKLREIEALGVSPFPFDSAVSWDVGPRNGSEERGGPHASPLIGALAKADLVLVCIAPDADADPVLRHFRSELAAAKPKSLVYLSTVGVYGDHDGAWVDETSECRPISKRSKERVAAEDAWRAFSGETNVPVAIIRLAGIYGPGRGPFEKIRSGSARRIVKPGQVFNRIHVDDIAQIVEAAFERRVNGVYNGSDDEPAPPQDVMAYAAGLLQIPPAREIAYEDADLTPMARSFYGENKRVRNDKIKRELGARLAYPTYREGLRAILAAEAHEMPRRANMPAGKNLPI
jgi:nucleoside-diphosphate-sugar epimerase